MLPIKPPGDEKLIKAADWLAFTWHDLAPRTEKMPTTQRSYDTNFLVRMPYPERQCPKC